MTPDDRRELEILRELERRDDRRNQEADLGGWLATYHGSVKPHAGPLLWAGPRADIRDAFAALPPAGDRPAVALLVEGGRSLGKTETARGYLLRDLLARRRTGIMWICERAGDAHSTARVIMNLVPPYMRGEKADNPRVRQWLQTPLGRLYPTARVMGGEEQIRLTLDGTGRTDAVVWFRGRGGQIRGQNEAGIRPDLAVLDDIVTPETAANPSTTDKVEAVVDDDVAGLGDLQRPCDRVLLANAIAFGDLADRKAASGTWRVVRGAVWTFLPPDSPAKRALLAVLRDQTHTEAERIQEAARRLADNPDAILGGARPTMPTIHTPLDLLLLEATLGTRAFGRAYQNIRSAAGLALWPMDKATWVPIEAGTAKLRTPAPLATARAAVWLDPRYSEDAERNDFAAACGVARVKVAGGTIDLALAAHVERCGTEGQRTLYWRAVDELVAQGIPAAAIVGGYETNGGVGSYLRDGFAADAIRRHALKLPVVVPEGFASTQGKYSIDRLEGLSYPIEAGTFAFAAHLKGTEAALQCDRLGTGYHDDAPDAFERARWRLAQQRGSFADLALALPARPW